MSKRGITFTKPEEPNFLKRLKQQAGYKEGPTIDTKRESLETAEDLYDRDEDQPTVVVLKQGDLTAEEAVTEQEKLEKEAATVPADLNSRIIFKARPKANTENSKTSLKQPKKPLLSFDADQDEEEDAH